VEKMWSRFSELEFTLSFSDIWTRSDSVFRVSYVNDDRIKVVVRILCIDCGEKQ